MQQTITLPALTGRKTIAQASDVFVYINSGFKDLNLDFQDKPTKETNLEICELTKNKTFAQIFTEPEEMCISQEQIIEFCRNHNDKLSKNGYTLFLFKVGKKFFVAFVDLDHYVQLFALVDPFSDAYVWSADGRHQFVLPQLTPKNPKSSPLDTNDTLTLESAIERVKKV